MSFTVNCVRFSSFARPGTFSRSSTLQSPFQFSRRMSGDTSGTSHAGSGMPTSSLNIGPWDVNNRIRVIGATLGLASAVGMLFDTFYRRATKQELNQAMEKLDAKIDREMGKLDAKIDGLTNALLHTNQRDKISAEAENRELRREIERLKSKEAKT
jgi:hypothetical protein